MSPSISLRIHILLIFQHFTLKLGNFVDFKAFFPAASMDFRYPAHVKSLTKRGKVFIRNKAIVNFVD